MISVIIPTYNESGNIIALIDRTRKTLENRREIFEVVVVDDNSPDRTAEIVRAHYKTSNIHVFMRTNEKGLSSAILYGITQSKGDIIIGMDADFNHPPEGLVHLINPLKRGGLVVASRFKKGGGMHGRLRYMCTYIYNLFLKYGLGFPTMDNMSGFYAIYKEDLMRLGIEKIYKGYGEYHLRLLWYAKQAKLKIRETPMYFDKRMFGRSKSNLFGMFISYTVCALQLKFNSR